MHFNLVAFLMVLLLAAVAAAAQDLPDDNFFDKDYADQHFKNENKTPPLEVEPQPTVAEEAQESDTEEQADTDDHPWTREMGSDSDSPRADSAEDRMQGVPLKKIGAIINSRDLNHFKNKTAELLRVAEKYKIPLGTVYAVGGVKEIADMKLMLSLQLRGAKIERVPGIPADYNVTKSPAWILYTEKGRVVLEGFDSPTRYLTDEGKYIPEK